MCTYPYQAHGDPFSASLLRDGELVTEAQETDHLTEIEKYYLAVTPSPPFHAPSPNTANLTVLATLLPLINLVGSEPKG